MKKFTQEEYDLLPGNVAAEILNGIGSDGQPVLKYSKSNLKNGDPCITHYWLDEFGKSWKKTMKFNLNDEY